MSIKSLNGFGDTIVEVLISVAVVSSVLGAGYVGANRSARAITNASEHQTATSIAQTQLELLNGLAGLPASLPSGGTCFINPSGTYVLATTSAQQALCNPYNPTSATSPQYPENFNVTITDVTPTGGSSALDTYEVQVQWQPLGGTASSANVDLFYQTAGQ